MTDTVDVQAQEVNPLDDKILTLKFSVKDINAILNLLGTELSFVKAVGLINTIQAQCAPQIDAINANLEAPNIPTDPESRN